MRKVNLVFLALPLFAAGALFVARPAVGQQPASSATPLPTASNNGAVTTVVVQGSSRSLFKIAIAPPPGDATASTAVVDTASKDLTLSSMFQTIEAKSFTANLEKEGMTIEPTSWRNVGADGVIKGNVAARGDKIHVELRLFVVSRGSGEVLKKEYDVAPSGVRAAVHLFDNEVVKYFTGTAGSFGTRLVFSATTGKGQKGIFAVDSDGQGLSRLNAVSNVALAPATFGGNVYYAGGLADGSYQLYKYPGNTQVMKQPGLVFGVAFSSSKMALVVSSNGVSDIFTGGTDGIGLSKVTSGGLNTHPAFGPGGQLAYVSNQGGNPQIYVDGKRVSFKGSYNMAPVWCNDPEGVKILFMGRDGANWDIFSSDASGGSVKRLTQDQGSNTYPACSPDGRTVAFFSTRGGLYLSNTQGQNQQKISSTTGESLRWEGN